MPRPGRAGAAAPPPPVKPTGLFSKVWSVLVNYLGLQDAVGETENVGLKIMWPLKRPFFPRGLRQFLS